MCNDNQKHAKGTLLVVVVMSGLQSGTKGTLRVLQLLDPDLTVFCVKTSASADIGQLNR